MNKSVFESAMLGERYERITHRSGLTVIVFPKKLTTAYAIMGICCGSVNTAAKAADGSKMIFPEGVAHFLEHKLFTCEDGSDAFEHFSDYGADANAYTSFNRTAYLFSCTENFGQSLGELIDFVTHPYFTPESVESEKPIITEEIKMYDDSPSEACFYGMLEGMYVHNKVKNNICGSSESIAKITPDILHSFYDRFYKLSNMYLIVCGNVSADQVLAVADAHLPSEPCGAFEEYVDVLDEPTTVALEYTEKKMQVSKPIFSIGFKDSNIPLSVYERYRKDAGMAILNEMIFSRATKIYSYLYENGIISSPNLDYGYTISRSFAYNFISGEASDPEAVLKVIKEYLEQAHLFEEDFKRGKRVMYAEFVKSFDSSESIANTLLSFVGDGAELFEYGKILESISFEEIKALLDELRSMPTTLCAVVPC